MPTDIHSPHPPCATYLLYRSSHSCFDIVHMRGRDQERGNLWFCSEIWGECCAVRGICTIYQISSCFSIVRQSSTRPLRQLGSWHEQRLFLISGFGSAKTARRKSRLALNQPSFSRKAAFRLFGFIPTKYRWADDFRPMRGWGPEASHSNAWEATLYKAT